MGHHSHRGCSAAVGCSNGYCVRLGFFFRSSWDELPSLIQRTVQPQDTLTYLVVGGKYGNIQDNEVTGAEVSEFEQAWSVPVLRVRHQTQTTSPPSVPDVAGALNTICEHLWLAKRRPKHTIEPALI